jgi:hypothetical protein
LNTTGPDDHPEALDRLLRRGQYVEVAESEDAPTSDCDRTASLIFSSELSTERLLMTPETWRTRRFVRTYSWLRYWRLAHPKWRSP